MTSLLDKRLVFVSGKGGVGKTTVAAALGLLASRAKKRVLVCEAEPSGDLAFAYECGETGYQPRQVAPGLYAMSMDTEAALREYLWLHFKVPSAVRLQPLAQAFDFVATAAPGVREILTIGKLCYEVRENHYDLVIVDAPASGHMIGELAAPVGINELARFGAIRTQTRWMLEILEDPARTGVWIVTTPEEMPVNEAVDLAARLKNETGVTLSAVIANRVLPELFGRSEEEIFLRIDEPEFWNVLAQAIDPSSPELVESIERVYRVAHLAVRLRRNGATHLQHLRAAIEAEVPIVYLPYLFDRGHGPRAIRQVAEALAEEIG